MVKDLLWQMKVCGNPWSIFVFQVNSLNTKDTDVNDAHLVSLLLTLNIFYTLI